MDVAGVTFGVAGLIGLFSTCVNVIEKVDSYNDVGVESRSLLARFEADKVRLRQWGRVVGIDKPQQGDSETSRFHKALEDPAVCGAVSKILQSIRDIDNGGDMSSGLPRDIDIRTPQFSGSDDSPSAQTKSRLRLDQFQPISRKHKIGWTLRNKTRAIALVDSFDSLVQVSTLLIFRSRSMRAEIEAGRF